MHIRPYKETDKINFRNICIETANATNKPEKEQRFILKLYCDYYIEQEPQNCFALADENDEAVGYILCSENFKRYRKNFAPYQRSIKNLGFGKYLYSFGEIIAHLPASKKATAHMHINLLPKYQHKGYGSQLIGTLTKHLVAKNIRSLMLVVSNENKNAVKFYKKNGFKPFFNFIKGTLMTLSF